MSDALWQGEERREEGPVTRDVIEAAIEAIVEKVVAREFVEHEKREAQLLFEKLEDLKKRAFPNGELEPHCDYHQSLIDAAVAEKKASEAKQRLYEMLAEKAMEKGIEGLMRALSIIAILGLLFVAGWLGMSVPDWVMRVIKWFA